MNFADLFLYLLVTAKALLYGVAVIFLFSGLDDLFIDLYFGIRSLYRRLFITPKHRPLTEEQLLQATEQPIAVLIPAWDESAVIRRMLENTIRVLNYTNYHIFVGTYPNDPDTQQEVELLREKFDNVHRIVTQNNGPTNKADCLNWVYQGIKLFEKENNLRFAIFVMEDSEDLIHPLTLKLFNYLIPRKDMVQVAVLPLPAKWYNFTEGHYADEFSENHYKNMVVREFLSGSVPSAGVGCAFSRRAIELTASLSHNELFNIDSLTEDYDIGVRLQPFGLKQIFVRQAIERYTLKKSLFSRKLRKVKVKEYIAIRENFPKTFRTAKRQKSRWIVGICLQGWASLGWPGPLSTKYMLYRDRKGLVNNCITIAGYYVLGVGCLYWVSLWLMPGAYRYPPLVSSGSWIWYVILVDTALMLARLGTRCYCVYCFYDLPQALLSIPRFFWANVINFAAGFRALYLYGKYLITGKLIAWDKTSHVYPSDAELESYRRKLGDLLLDRRLITVRQLDEALLRQKQDPRPLGAILLDMGLVKEEELIQALGVQLSLSTREIDPYEVPLELLIKVPREVATHYCIFPVKINQTGRLMIATNKLVSREQLAQMEQRLGHPLDLCLTTRDNLSLAIEGGYRRLAELEPKPQSWGMSSLGLNYQGSDTITPAQLTGVFEDSKEFFLRRGARKS
jgi:adsorption protein B